MTPDETRQLVHEAADAAVAKWLTTLGLDATDPLEVQKDMAWLRSSRELSSRIGTKAVLAAVTIAVGGLLSAVWLGIRTAVGAKIGPV